MPTLRERILESARTLPPAPRVFAELDRLLGDPNGSLDDLAALIKRDATLVGHVIRAANRHARREQPHTASVDIAVARIGREEVARIAAEIARTQMPERPLVAYGIETAQLRRHVLHTAFVCQELAIACGTDPATAYAAGLMRPIGVLVLDRLAEQYGNIPAYHPGRDPSYLAWEGRCFGISNCEVAEMVLREWEFPESIIEAVPRQYLIRPADMGNPLACLLNLASGIVADAGAGLLGENTHWGARNRTLFAIGLSQEELELAGARARDSYAELQTRLQSDSASASDSKSTPNGAVSIDANGFPLRVRVVQHEGSK